MKQTRSCCPIACTLDIVGDKWTILIVRDMLLGRQHFKEFMASPEKIASNILTNRLERLVAYDLVEKFASPDVLGREAYRLTVKGRSLQPLVRLIANWGLRNLPGTEVKMKSPSL